MAVVIGGALGLRRGATALAVHPAMLALPLAIAIVTLLVFRHFYPFPKFRQISSSRQLLMGIALLLSSALLVLAAESILVLDWPSVAGLIAGVGTGLALVGAWIEGDASIAGTKLAVLLLYFAAGLVAISTLLTVLPPSTFWVVSAIIPAWQARRLVVREDLESSTRLLNAATRMFVGVLAIALVWPAVLLYR